MRRFLAVLLLGALLLTGCSVQVGNRIGGTLSNMVTLDAPATVRADTPAEFVLTLRNTGSSPLQLDFSSGQRVDFTLSRGGKVVWQASHGMAFIMVLGSLELGAGDSRQFEVQFSGRDNEGRPLPPGRYELRGWVTAQGEGQRLSAVKTVEITGR